MREPPDMDHEESPRSPQARIAATKAMRAENALLDPQPVDDMPSWAAEKAKNALTASKWRTSLGEFSVKTFPQQQLDGSRAHERPTTT
jgi:hypothetical protein